MKTATISSEFKLEPVVRKARLKDIDEGMEDLVYWLSRPVKERLAAVTFLVSQALKPGERMDKSIITKIKVRRK